MSLRSFESDATFSPPPRSDPDTEHESSSDSSLDSDSTLADDEVYDDQYLLPHQDFLEAAGDRWNLPRRNGEGIVEFESRLKQALEALGDESDSTSNAQSTDDEEGDDDLWPFVAHRLSKSMTRLNSESDENVHRRRLECLPRNKALLKETQSLGMVFVNVATWSQRQLSKTRCSINTASSSFKPKIKRKRKNGKLCHGRLGASRSR
eukprot:PhM_4_TR10013/c2_g2_i4/m.34877